MLFYTIDQTVRSLLLKEGKSIHHYLIYLKLACDGLKKLNTHSLKNINTKKLTVNSYKAVATPCDFVDWVRVGFEMGENVRPLVYDSKLNRLNNYDATGEKIVYDSVDSVDTGYSYDGQYLGYTDTLFGFDHSRSDYKFNVFPERKEIQLSPDYQYDYIILEYISDGLEVDAATKVDPIASESLEKYMLWQFKVHSKTAGEGEKQAAKARFDEEHRLLRAAKNNLSREGILDAVYGQYSGTYR